MFWKEDKPLQMLEEEEEKWPKQIILIYVSSLHPIYKFDYVNMYLYIFFVCVSVFLCFCASALAAVWNYTIINRPAVAGAVL